MPHSLGTFIRTRRQDLGLTQEQLAERVGGGMRQAEISRLEHNRVLLPRRERLEQLAIALEVSLGDLLVATDWLEDNHASRLESSDGQSRNGLQDRSDDMPPLHEEVAGGIAETVEYISDLQAMLNEMLQKLAEAERVMTTLLRQSNNHGNSAGYAKPPTGTIEDWETSAPIEF